MPATAAALLLALLAGQNEEENLTPELEEPDLTQAEQDAIELETMIMRRLPYGPAPVDLPRGDTVFVEIEIPLKKLPAGPIDGRVRDLKVQARLTVLPLLEIPLFGELHIVLENALQLRCQSGVEHAHAHFVIEPQRAPVEVRGTDT